MFYLTPSARPSRLWCVYTEVAWGRAPKAHENLRSYLFFPFHRLLTFFASCFNPISLGSAILQRKALARNKFEFKINANLFKHTFRAKLFFLVLLFQVNWNKILYIKRTLKFKINPFGEAFRELNLREFRCSIVIEFWFRQGFWYFGIRWENKRRFRRYRICGRSFTWATDGFEEKSLKSTVKAWVDQSPGNFFNPWGLSTVLSV